MGIAKAGTNYHIGETMSIIKGIIITGTSGSGKTVLARGLQEENPQYEMIQAITTREPRDDDENHYIYINDLDFEKSRKTFFSVATYRNAKYAYGQFEISQAFSKGKIPILLVSPESFSAMKKEESQGDRTGDNSLEGFISFFIDANDDELDRRLINRDGKRITDDDKKRRCDDRQFSDSPDYIIQNLVLKDTIAIIDKLVELYGVSTALSEKEIDLFIRNGMLISGAEKNNIKGASYDLRLGDEYYYRGEIMKLEDKNLRLTIEPYDYALVSSKEEICLPKDVIAHFGLTVGLFCQGIILSNGQQVDPGFRGRLFCLLFNTSNQAVTIKRGAHYATIEFAKMYNFARNYNGRYQEKRDIIDVLPANAMQGGMSELKREIEELKYESRNMQSIYISVIAIIFAAISILLILNN